MSSQAIEVNDKQFDEVTGKGVALVDFWAPWCGPCQAQGPILEEAAADLDGQAVIAKINVDICKRNAARFGVRGIPMLILFKDGKEISRLVGLQSKEKVLSAVRAALNHAAA